MNRTRVVALIAAGCVALTALVSIVFWLRLPSRMPSDADYARVNELIESQKQPGDIAILAPAWADRGRQFITAVPVYAGYDLERDRYEGTSRQWLVALPDVPRFSLSDTRATLLQRGPSAAQGEHIGELYVEPFAIAGPKVAYSFLEGTPGAEVSVGGRRPEICRGPAHQCSHGEWNKVQAGWYEVEERPAHCVWAHPIGSDPVIITYRDVPLPPGSHIAGWGGLVGQAPANDGPAVTLTMVVNDQVIGNATTENRFGKQPFDIAIRSPADHATFTFLVTTPNNNNRGFCFDAWVQPE